MKNFYHYNYYIIYYEIIQNNLVKEKNKFLDIGIIYKNYTDILIENKYVLKDNPIVLNFFYLVENNNDIKNLINKNNLIQYEIDLYQIFEKNQKILNQKSSIFIKIKINECQKVILDKLIIDNKEIKNNIKIINNGIYNNEKEEKSFKHKIIKEYKRHKTCDIEYQAYIDKKNNLSKYLYHIKGKIIKNPKSNEDLTYIVNLDKKLHSINKDNVNNFNSIEKKLKTIDNAYLTEK